MGNHDEIKLINGILEGNQQALKHFYQDNFGSIQHLVLNNSGNLEDAKDVFQEALLVMYQKLKSGQAELNCSIRTYFYGICMNLWRNGMRKKLKTPCCGAMEHLRDEFISPIEQKEKELMYRKHFSRLNCKCQRILTLFFEGKSMSEIAQLTNYSEGYVRKKKFDCKKLLMERIENDPLYDELKESGGDFKAC